MKNLSLLNQEWLALDDFKILTQHNVIVCNVEVGYSNRNEEAFVELIFTDKTYKMFESDISSAEMNEDVKLELLNLIYEENEIQANMDHEDPDHRADQIREWKENNY